MSYYSGSSQKFLDNKGLNLCSLTKVMEMLESVVKTKTKEKLRDMIGAVRDLVLDNLLKGYRGNNDAVRLGLHTQIQKN